VFSIPVSRLPLSSRFQDFSDLIIYTASVPRFSSFAAAVRQSLPWHMASFGESRANAFAASPLLSLAFVEYNKLFNRYAWSQACDLYARMEHSLAASKGFCGRH
jgi:hypothetical protein